MVSVRALLPAVSSSPRSMSLRSFGSKRLMSPTTLRRTPFACSLSTSFCSALLNSFSRSATSSAGRRQFSELKANSVR
jgi:hypothetical protein